jgi:hypothetical protein
MPATERTDISSGPQDTAWQTYFPTVDRQVLPVVGEKRNVAHQANTNIGRVVRETAGRIPADSLVYPKRCPELCCGVHLEEIVWGMPSKKETSLRKLIPFKSSILLDIIYSHIFYINCTKIRMIRKLYSIHSASSQSPIYRFRVTIRSSKTVHRFDTLQYWLSTTVGIKRDKPLYESRIYS